MEGWGGDSEQLLEGIARVDRRIAEAAAHRDFFIFQSLPELGRHWRRVCWPLSVGNEIGVLYSHEDVSFDALNQ